MISSNVFDGGFEWNIGTPEHFMRKDGTVNLKYIFPHAGSDYIMRICNNIPWASKERSYGAHKVARIGVPEWDLTWSIVPYMHGDVEAFEQPYNDKRYIDWHRKTVFTIAKVLDGHPKLKALEVGIGSYGEATTYMQARYVNMLNLALYDADAFMAIYGVWFEAFKITPILIRQLGPSADLTTAGCRGYRLTGNTFDDMLGDPNRFKGHQEQIEKYGAQNALNGGELCMGWAERALSDQYWPEFWGQVKTRGLCYMRTGYKPNKPHEIERMKQIDQFTTAIWNERYAKAVKK